MNVKKKSILIFAMLFVLLSAITGLYQLCMWDLEVENIGATLDGERDRCMNVVDMNNDNLPDIINNERTTADKLSFSISPTCYKLINNFDVMLELEIRSLFFGNIWSYVGLAILSLIVSGLYAGFKIKKEINDNYEGDDDDENFTYY